MFTKENMITIARQRESFVLAWGFALRQGNLAQGLQNFGATLGPGDIELNAKVSVDGND